MHNITAIILTRDEEVNIQRCINSVKPIADRIVVVDSGSKDNTVQIARSLGVEIYTHTFKHYADQFNWALDNVNINTIWVYRIDADEYVTPELAKEIELKCNIHENDDVTAFLMKYKVYFLGKFLKRGGVYPFVKISVFKPQFARFDYREMGEHIVFSQGRCLEFENDCIHYDLKPLTSFVEKHNLYASREVSDHLNRIGQGNLQFQSYKKAEKTRKTRDYIYYKLPMFFRARLLYIYRYYIRLGFLDGKEGKIYAFLQTYWYRYLVDAKIYEKSKTN